MGTICDMALMSEQKNKIKNKETKKHIQIEEKKTANKQYDIRYVYLAIGNMIDVGFFKFCVHVVDD